MSMPSLLRTDMVNCREHQVQKRPKPAKQSCLKRRHGRRRRCERVVVALIHVQGPAVATGCGCYCSSCVAAAVADPPPSPCPCPSPSSSPSLLKLRCLSGAAASAAVAGAAADARVLCWSVGSGDQSVSRSCVARVRAYQPTTHHTHRLRGSV